MKNWTRQVGLLSFVAAIAFLLTAQSDAQTAVVAPMSPQNALPPLPRQQGEVPHGPAIGGGPNAHPVLGKMPALYPDNSSAPKSLFVRPEVVTRNMRLNATSLVQPLVVRSTTLKLYHESLYRIQDNAQVAPNRWIYEIVTTFSTPLSVHGNTWNSGTRVFLVDAQTGDAIESATSGTGFKRGHPATLPPPHG